MMTRLSTPRLVVLALLTVSVLWAAGAWAATDNFERADGALGALWDANTDLVILNGNMHNQSSTTGWDSFLAVYNVSNPNQATILWPANGDGVDATGSELGGIAIVNSFSKSASGYLVYLYSGSIRLYEIQNGSATTTKFDEQSTALSVSPGDEFQVKWDAATWQFTVYVNGTSAGTLTDNSHTVDLTTAYAGVMLYGGDAYNNDIEEFTSEYVSQSSDTTPPGAVTDLAASAASSSSISLSWTATGDDGATGTASAYDIRYSTSSITSDTDFNNATAVSGEPTPAASGSAESMTVSGLSASTLYHFAMKVRDEANNWSSLSNDASATTDAGSGGGSATYSCQLDDFDRVDIGSNWSVTAEHFIESGELALQTTASGWSYLAVYQKPGAVAAKLQWSATNSAALSGYIPGGLAILLDNSDPASANGYFLYRKETLDIYEINNGSLGSKIDGATVSQAAPAPGDIIKAEITDDATGTQKEVKFYINDQLDATFTISNASDLANLYVGTFQWGGGTSYDNVNNIDNFWACYPGATNNPQNILKISGDLQKGQPNTQLAEPIKVQVTDTNDTGVEGVLLDFQVIQGDASLPDIDNFAFDGNIWKEVESGRLYETSTIEQSPDASNGEYVTYTWITGLRGKKLVEVPFFTPDSGLYDIYLRVYSPDGSHNTAFVGIDNADSVRFDVDANSQGSWAWIPIMNNAVIDNGSHVMKIFAYESPFNFDKFLIQKDGGSAPSGMGGEGPDFPNVTDSLGFAQTHVQFGSDASQDVVIHVTGEKNDGTALNNSPAVFTEYFYIPPTNAYEMGSNETFEDHPTNTRNLQVTVWDDSKNPVSDVPVSWEVAQGAGTLSASSTQTNNQGVAVVVLTIDAKASGQVIVQASANKTGGTPLLGSPVTKTITILNPAKTVQRVSPPGDVSGTAGGLLSFDDSPTVKVLAEDGTPFQGYPVEFRVTAGNGTVGTTTAPTEQTVTINTDADGLAKARWQLGDVGANTVQALTPDLTDTPIVFNANADPGVPAKLVKFSGDGQTGAVGLPTNEPFVAQVTDVHDNAISNQNVKFTITDPTDAYFGNLGNRDTTLTTDPEGKVSVTMTYGSELNKVHSVTAEVVDTDVPVETFTATPTIRVAKSIVYVSGRGQSAEVTSTLANAFFVKALDPFSNPVEGQTITFKVVAGNGNIGGLPEVTKTTNADGLASAKLTLGTLAGDSVHVVEASAVRTDGTGEALQGSPVTFKATGLPKEAEKLVKDTASDGQTQQVGVALQKPVRVRVTDTYGNGVKGHTVNFVVQPGNGKLLDDMGEGTSKDVVTADSGYAAINWIMPEANGDVYLQASGKKPNSADLQDSPMQFTATAVVGPADSMVAITPDTTLKGTVGKLLSQKVEVKIVDRFGNLVSNIPVTFNITAGGGTVNGAANVTLPSGDDGHAAVDWTLGTVSGTENNIVEVTSSVPNNPLLTFKASAKPDVADSMKPDLTHDPFGRVGKMLATGPMKVTIVDKYGNPVPDQPVTFTVQDVNGNKGYLEVEGQITQLVQSDADGIATVNWYLGPQPGSENNKLVASSKRNNVDLVNSPHTFTVSAVTDSAYKVFSVTDSTTQLEANLGATVQLKVKVTDRFNNPVGNYKVKFEVLSHETANGGSLDAPNGDVTLKEKTTDSNGIASVNFTIGNKGGVNINQVRVSAMKNEIEHLVGSPMVFYVTGKVTDATQMNDFRGDHQEGTVDEFLPTELEVAAQDNFGNNVGGQSIKFRILPVQGLADSLIGALGNGTATDTSVITDPTTGIAKIKWRMGKKTGQYQVEVTSKNGSDDLDRSGFKFTATAHAGKTDAMASSIQAFPAEAIVSDGANKITIVVTLHDKFGNPVDGKAVTLAATGEGNMVEQPMSVSDATGQVTGKISSRIAEAKMVSAHDINSNVEIGDSVTVRFKPDVASAINKAPQPNGDAQIRNVGTVLPESLKVSISDKFGNRIGNYPVRFVVTYGGGQILETQPVVTDSTGIAFSRLRLGTQAGVNTVEARADGLSNSPVRFTETGLAPTQPFNFVKIDGDNQTANAGQKLPEPLCVQLLDANDWSVWGEDILYEIKLNDGDIVSNNPVKTDQYGKACAEVVVGKDTQTLNIITATSMQYPSVSTTFYETSTSGNATTIVYVSGSGDSAIVAQPLIHPFVVKATDDFGNAVPGTMITFRVVEDASVDGAGSLEGGTIDNPVKVLTKPTNQAGLASVYYTLGKHAGMNRVRASATNLLPTYREFEAKGLPDYPFSMEKFVGDNQRMEMGKVLNDPIEVLVKDRFGNPAPGGAVSFVVTEGQGQIVTLQPVLSDRNGIASAKWKLGPRALNIVQNKAIATSSLPGGTFTVPFGATGELNYYPEFTSFNDPYNVSEGDTLTFLIVAQDKDGESITYSWSNLPDSAKVFDNIDGVKEFQWIVGYDLVQLSQQKRTFNPVFTARDTRNGKTKRPVEIVVRNFNHAPKINSFSPYTDKIDFQPNSIVQFSVDAFDPDGDALTYQWFRDETPVGSDANTYEWNMTAEPDTNFDFVKVVIQDGELSTELTWLASGVELANFSSFVTPYRGVTLNWETSSESNNVGFNVLRSKSQSGEYEMVNERIIPHRDDGKYHFTDIDVETGQKYYYKLEDVSTSGAKTQHGPVEAKIGVPSKFDLSQNYPNPFNPTTSIRFQLPRAVKVTLEIYNIMGQRVRTLVNTTQKPGYHVVIWNGLNEAGAQVGSGVYYYRIVAGDFVSAKKMVLLK